MILSPILHRSFLVFSLSLFVAATFVPRHTCRSTSYAQASLSTSFAGQLLVATPSMPDEDFAGTRILLLDHDRSGAVGVIINRPRAHVGDAVTVLAGGPLELQAPLFLHRPGYRDAGTRVLFHDVAITAGPDGKVVADALNGVGPEQVWIVDGYAGWGPGQLEGELAHGAWRLEARGDIWR